MGTTSRVRYHLKPVLPIMPTDAEIGRNVNGNPRFRTFCDLDKSYDSAPVFLRHA